MIYFIAISMISKGLLHQKRMEMGEINDIDTSTLRDTIIN